MRRQVLYYSVLHFGLSGYMRSFFTYQVNKKIKQRSYNYARTDLTDEMAFKDEKCEMMCLQIQ